MRKETIKFEDFDGNQREEDYYFNLQDNEIAMMQMSTTGGYSELLERITKTQDVPAIAQVFESIIKASYGVKTPDGKSFIKREADYEAFKSSEAYSTLFMTLLTDPKYAAEFFTQIVSKKHQDQIREEMNKKLKEQNLVTD